MRSVVINEKSRAAFEQELVMNGCCVSFVPKDFSSSMWHFLKEILK